MSLLANSGMFTKFHYGRCPWIFNLLGWIKSSLSCFGVPGQGTVQASCRMMCVSPSTEGSRSPHSSSSTRLTDWLEPSMTKQDMFLKRRPSPHLAPWQRRHQSLACNEPLAAALLHNTLLSRLQKIKIFFQSTMLMAFRSETRITSRLHHCLCRVNRFYTPSWSHPTRDNWESTRTENLWLKKN